MLVKKYRTEIVSIQCQNESIFTLEFRSLNGKFKYHPGQFLHLSVEQDYDGSGQWPESRCFSIQSSPDEENIKITYAVKGLFTRHMESALSPGSRVWLKLPYGDLFSKPHNKMKSVFIAGGTGITPFLSLFRHQSFEGYSNSRVYLGFKSERFNIYETELKFSDLIRSEISYEDVNGILDLKKIFAENGTDASYIISGPPAMIKAFRHGLIEMGLPDCQILTDDWE